MLISRGAVFPFIGAGFSKNASPEYPDAKELARFLADHLSVDLDAIGDQSNPLAIGDWLVDHQMSLGELHDTICDQTLPDEDEPSDFHRLFMALPWRKIFTTNFDLLLEEAGGQRYVAVATNERFREWRLRQRAMILKLCGDKNHRTLLRSTSGRVEGSCLQEEIGELLDDLVRHLDGGTLLYLGYRLRDPFMSSALDWVLKGAIRQGLGPSQLRHSYMAVFEKPDNETAQWMARNRITPLELFRISKIKTEAMNGFVRECVEFCHDEAEKNIARTRRLLAITPMREDTEPARSERSESFKHLVRASDTVLVVTTGGEEAATILQDVVAQVLAGESLKSKVVNLTVNKLTTENVPGIEAVLASGFVAIFLADGLSSQLERLALIAMQQRCRVVILCSNSGVLGHYTTHMRHKQFDREGLRDYLREEIFRATVDARLTRSEEYLANGMHDTAVVEAWIACERAVRHAFWKLGLEETGRMRGTIAQIRDLLSALSNQPDVQHLPTIGDILASRKLRNKVVHDAVVPTLEQARSAVTAIMWLARLLGWDSAV